MTAPRPDWPDWEDDELGLSFATREAARLFRRARPRIWLVVVVACLIAGAFVARRQLKHPPFEAELILRIVESDKALTEELRPPHAYKDYLWSVCLSGPRLREVIERHQLYADKYALDPQLAVESMRDDLDIELWGNYFDPDYFDPTESRTARVAITWRHKDPEVVLAVVRELAAIINEVQAHDRKEVFRIGEEEVYDALDRGNHRLDALRRDINRKEALMATATPERAVGLAIELRDLRYERKAIEKSEAAMNKAGTDFELSAALEREHGGIQFELLDPGVVLPRVGGGRASTAVSAVLIVVGTLLLGALVAGAFEGRVHAPSDVRRLGMPLLGALPSFPGDRVGALSERLRAEDRLRLERR